MSGTWVMLLLIWTALAVTVAVATHNRKRSPILYFLCSLLLSPILAIIPLAISGGLKRA